MPQTEDPIDFHDDAEKEREKNRLKTTVSNLYNNLVNVTVVTGVGDLGVQLGTTEGTEKLSLAIGAQGQSVQAFVTQLDLLEGDIVTTLPVGYDELPSVQELHERNVAAAAQVLPDNIAAIVNAGREVIKLFNA